MSNFHLSAQSREEAGKGSSRRLRRLEGLVPAIVYGGKNAPKSIQLAHKDLKRGHLEGVKLRAAAASHKHGPFVQVKILSHWNIVPSDRS